MRNCRISTAVRVGCGVGLEVGMEVGGFDGIGEGVCSGTGGERASGIGGFWVDVGMCGEVCAWEKPMGKMMPYKISLVVGVDWSDLGDLLDCRLKATPSFRLAEAQRRGGRCSLAVHLKID